MSDQINHPSHYLKNGRECIDVMIEKFGTEAVINFCECNEFKYLWRAGLKEGNSAEQDRAKAEWYRKKAEELRSGIAQEVAIAAKALADQLTEVFNGFNEDDRGFFEKLPVILENIRYQVGIRVAEKTINIYSRYLDAPFITRWYWRRKLNKALVEFDTIHKDLETQTKDYANH